MDREYLNSILERLGSKPLTVTGHGYERYGPIPIREAVEKSTSIYDNQWKEKPALGLIMVVLAANRDYNKVVLPNLIRIEEQYPGLATFDDLSKLIEKLGQKRFLALWGHQDQKKYDTLRNLLQEIGQLRKDHPGVEKDYELMHAWGQNTSLTGYKKDPIGRIFNIGPATFQHLRMTFGVDTTKPDERFKHVLKKEFGFTKVTELGAVEIIERMAGITGVRALVIDQILVKYVTSYPERVL